MDENISLGELDELYDALDSEESNCALKEAGHDGIISSLDNDELEYIVSITPGWFVCIFALWVYGMNFDNKPELKWAYR